MPNDDMIDTSGLRRFAKVIMKIEKGILRSIEKAPNEATLKLFIGAKEIRDTAMQSMTDTPQTGNWYKRGRKWHIASSLGNPPAVDKGILRSSIVPRIVGNMEVEVGAIVAAPHGYWMEFGTKWSLTEHIISPRPWLKPAIDKHMPEIIEDIGQNVVYEILKGIIDPNLKGKF